MASQIQVGDYAAVSTTDERTLSGYYMCCITSKPYILNEDTDLKDADNIRKGELVCNITWLNQVPSCRTFFSHGLKDDLSLNSVTRIQYIIDPNVNYTFLESVDELPPKVRKRFHDLKDLKENGTL